MTNEKPLKDTVCLVTRPAHQASNLNKLLQKSGFKPLNFATIAIQASAPVPFLTQLQDTIKPFDIALFVSRNAVDFTFKYLKPELLPDTLQLGVIGKGTWLALQKQGVQSSIIPADSYNSEGLLASVALQQVEGKKIIIFRGQQGRNLLGDTLLERGAQVQYQEVYQRVLPEFNKDHFERLTQPGFPAIAIFTSAEGLKNCLRLLSDNMAQKLRSIPWLLISERMRETARDLGHNADIIIAISASDEGVLQAIQEWQQSKLNHHT